ncbi:PIG-L deacetylase family protein [Streptomyces sp. 130]|uniref:PIG-L deacetylase family protein n=1 Tax=Streptomyces sp. 130 TaxID=2591006 RepID=UPI0021B0DFD5|nr:PIG-L family deacetylase [Streptomyces sp. 130]
MTSATIQPIPGAGEVPDIFRGRSLVVLSPHLDDAVLSCGALLSACPGWGSRVTTVTVFNGRPEGPLSEAAVSFHESIGLVDDPMGPREAEDDRAHGLLGVTGTRLGMPEALYRCDATGHHLYPHDQDIFVSGPARDLEPGLTTRLAAALRALPAVQEADLVLAPLGVGRHADHVLVAAAARLLDRPRDSVLWYEELPYILYDHCAGWEADLAPGTPLISRYPREHWERKLDAIDCYASQHPILWFEPESRREEITAHAAALGGGSPAERYWWRP